MSDSDYVSGRAVGSRAERARTAVELEDQRQREAEAEAQRDAQATARRMREQLRVQQRPLGERLLLERCNSCHTLAVIDGAAKGAVGWRFTVERMRWWHGASLSMSDAAAVASHLRAVRPASQLREWLEAGLAMSCVVSAATLPLAWRRLRAPSR